MITVKDISKTYISGRGHIAALSNVSLAVKKATALVVMGKSGSGKTTLLNCLGGLEKPDNGTISCFGTDLQKLSGNDLSRFQRRNLGIVFQHGNLISYLSVSDNIAFPLTLNRINGKQRTRRVHELLAKIGLPDAGEALPSELSGGEIQRVSFARAISHHPKMLLADEPTASLDSETGRDLIQLMCDMTIEQHCTMIIATHDTDLAETADETIYLKDGSISGGNP